MKEIIVGLLVGLTALVAFFTSGVTFAVASAPLAAVSVWEALNLLSNIIVPIVGAIVAVVVWLHKRINTLEQSQAEVESSVFGNKRDALNQGVLIGVSNLNNRLNDIEDELNKLKEYRRREEERREQK